MFNLFGTAVPAWGQITYNLTVLSPKRDCGSKRVNGRIPRTYVDRIAYRVAGHFMVCGMYEFMKKVALQQPVYYCEILGVASDRRC